MKVYLGIDVGSISTKLVLIDEQGQILAHFYFRTGGNPIKAIQEGIKKLKNQIEKDNLSVQISGVATTGSARYLAGVITGADLIKNEITAHAKGTSFLVPDAKTIIEIGGQDSKVIILENKVAIDFAMNLVCLSEDTKIIMDDYLPKPITQIRTGEKVLTHKGRFRKVNQVFERSYQGNILEIALSKLKSFKITPQHKILSLKRKDVKCYQNHTRNNIAVCKPQSRNSCKKRCTKYMNFSWEPKFIPAEELEKGDFVATPLSLDREMSNSPSIDYSLVKTEPRTFRPFKIIDKFVFKSDLLRLLGYYLAEGYILYNRARRNKEIKYPCGVSFVFNINEQDYIDDIKNIISENFSNLNIKTYNIPERKTAVISIYSKVLAEYFQYLCSSKADKKKLNVKLLNLKPILQKEILKGFFRGDGYLKVRGKNVSGSNKTPNRYVASTVSKDLAHQLYWLFLRNQIRVTFRKSLSRTKGGKYVYFISIHGSEINKLDALSVEITRDSSKSFIYSNWIFEPIREIKKSKFNGKVYNLNVEEDNSYIANLMSVKNCAAGTGSFLDAQAFRLKIPIEEFGELALSSKNPTTIGSRCTVFCESDMIHKQQIGHRVEDIIAGLCQGLARNFLANVAKGKNIKEPIVFLGGVSENIGMRNAFEKALGQKILVPEYNTVMGAFGVALLIKDNPPSQTKFSGFEVSNKDIKCTSFDCKDCPNQCEVIEARIDGKIIARWNDRCGKWSNLAVDV